VLRFLTAGESHGRALVVIVEGLPAGLPVTTAMIQDELGRRRLGYGRGPRMRFEKDDVTIVGGVRHGLTLGSPVAIEIGNSEWDRGKWNEEMSPDPGATKAPVTQPRPGHADLAGMQKYGFDDARNVLERASARETAARVAAGALAKALLRAIGAEVISHVIQMGPIKADPEVRPTPADLVAVDESEVRCFDAEATAEMVLEIKRIQKAGDSLGGIVEVLAYGIPVGLGSHVHWDRKLDSLLAQALMSIQAVKGVEIGDGFDNACRPGSEAHDPIVWDDEAAQYRRLSGRSGGIEGGMSTGEVLRVRAAMKPIATVPRALATIDVRTGEATQAHHQRSDVAAVPAAGIVAEAMVALVLADAVAEKFGGDSVPETSRNVRSYLDNLQIR